MNITGTTTERDVPFGFQETGIFSKHEFLQTKPWAAFPVLVFLVAASFVGTAGNVLTLLAIIRNKSVRNVESMFIVNLAISDLYVTTVADPTSIIAKLEGEHFFERIPRLCQVIAKLCTISCATSLLTITAMSINRYIYVCHNHLYKKVFSKRTSLLICMSVYCFGLLLVLLNQAGVGDHGFDRKSLDCIWDRMATYPYTVVYSVALVWIPCLTIGICYLRLYCYVHSHKAKMNNYNKRKTTTTSNSTGPPTNPKLQLAKTFILIYAVFVTCWAPYALLIVIDHKDEFSHEIHVYLTVWAHMHPSLNWLIYYFTQQKYAAAYRSILSCGPGSASRHPPSPKSRENSSDKISDKNHQSPVYRVPIPDSELRSMNENHYMEWKPITKSISDVSLMNKGKENESDGNGFYRKLYEVRNIHSEGEVQTCIRRCSTNSDLHSYPFDKIDKEKFRGSVTKRRYALADGLREINDHSSKVLNLIDQVCNSQALIEECSNNSIKISATFESSPDVKEKTTGQK